MVGEKFTIGKVTQLTGVRTTKINRCVDSGLIHFTRDPSSDFRLFDENAVRILNIYHALDMLRLKLTHNEICMTISLFTVDQLEEYNKKGHDALLKFITHHWGEIRP